MLKKCKLCGREFQPAYNGQVYCSDYHYSNCKIYGKKVFINRKYYNDPHNVCDSKQCISEWWTSKNIEKYGCKDLGEGDRSKALEKRRLHAKKGMV